MNKKNPLEAIEKASTIEKKSSSLASLKKSDGSRAKSTKERRSTICLDSLSLDKEKYMHGIIYDETGRAPSSSLLARIAFALVPENEAKILAKYNELIKLDKRRK